MPTIHLSLPEWMYDELKQKADELGIQMTDLVKLFIKKGLEGDFERNEENEEKKENAKYDESIAFLEAKVAQLDSLLVEVLKKLQILEEEKDEEEEQVEVVDSNQS
ncbi:conserved hypothetical protein [Sulfolobus islandicus Y.G.57.14]|jgi:phage-related minor tail protein|uniref:CopG-like ribbon-helix-helix domain-containing protein n=10 Tax=Saccharolobus islandicus TaxID=43080 RepID=M9U6F2_SACIS|nr:hypothetical protein [Sulfolobus islandicus]ACP34382.1 conserved hypothetical protein [Sulfolobus islandicus L.S.2.15]ACP37087.1 conserved hypothetical protein [Sulfolobus islandicus M.14.25]ACP44494.1 conserved hypothetical protein [Sulfolobus islandicus Y.G.57.14]ACP49707.1 conserved hypothetical protein [Sulfolobus islandicus Y.N.15.51]ACP54226.1 conserved hypothetical protein [Sulfolobus islandicus M.16.27]